MQRVSWVFFAALLLVVSPCRAGFLDDLTREVLPSGQKAGSLDDSTIVKGLKEALATGTERAVKEVAKPDGYFGNQLIKILLPEKVQRAADILGTLGYQQQVDELVLSMNRAAEKAAPKAARFFADAIRQMTVEDAREILNGGDTAATMFFEKKTRAQLLKEFKPVVTGTMDQVGTARAYKEMIGTYETTPLAALAGTPSLDLDTYVSNKALDGLFTMVGEEEKKIRSNPAARTTDLLRKVFGGT
jgi:RNA binding exosome subunit